MGRHILSFIPGKALPGAGSDCSTRILSLPLFPQNINMLILLGLVIGDTVTAQAFASVPWFVAMIGLMGASLWLMGNALPGILLAIPLLLFGPMAETPVFAYVDLGPSMFYRGGCLALAVAVHKGRNLSGFSGWCATRGSNRQQIIRSRLYSDIGRYSVVF